MNRMMTVVLVAITAAIALPSVGCIVHRDHRPPARETVIVHDRR